MIFSATAWQTKAEALHIWLWLAYIKHHHGSSSLTAQSTNIHDTNASSKPHNQSFLVSVFKFHSQREWHTHHAVLTQCHRPRPTPERPPSSWRNVTRACTCQPKNDVATVRSVHTRHGDRNRHLAMPSKKKTSNRSVIPIVCKSIFTSHRPQLAILRIGILKRSVVVWSHNSR